jgi:YfiH family protein
MRPETAPAEVRDPDWLVPDWDAEGVGALMTTRRGGVSGTPFDSLNLRDGLGDDARAVACNLQRLRRSTDAVPVWLRQVHGTRVARLTAADAVAGAATHEADACVTAEPGIACAVQVADCLPLLLAAPNGRGVAAAHAGWRGLAAGVLEATVQALCELAACQPLELQAWIGPCIGPQRFEVGGDVLAAFGVPDRDSRFRRHSADKWLADLPGLAHDRLASSGVRRITGGQWCTASDASRFYSFRRDGVTGRMAALVWIDGSRRR